MPDFAAYSAVNGSVVFTPLSWRVFEARDGPCTRYCVENVTLSANASRTAALILRVEDIADATWAALLRPAESAVFVLAAVLFSVFFFGAVYRGTSLVVATWPEAVASAFVLSQLCVLCVFCLLRAMLFVWLRAGLLPWTTTAGTFALVRASNPAGVLPGDGRVARLDALAALAEAMAGDEVLRRQRAARESVLHDADRGVGAGRPQFSGAECAAPATTPQSRLDRAYKVMVAGIALVLGLLVATYGAMMFVRLRRAGGFGLWQFGIVATATATGPPMQAALEFEHRISRWHVDSSGVGCGGGAAAAGRDVADGALDGLAPGLVL